MHPRDIRTMIERAMAGVRKPFRGLIARVNNAPDNQLTQITALDGETLPDVEMMQQFGFSASPPAGTQCVVLPLGGKTAHGIIIATENGSLRFKPLQPGETVIYNAFGDHVVLRANRITEINCEQLVVNASKQIVMNTPLLKTSGDATIGGSIGGGGDISAKGNISDQGGTKTMAGMRAVYNGHHNGNTPPPAEKM